MHFSIIEQVALLVFIALSLGSFLYELWKRIFIVFKGTGSFPFDRLWERCFRFFREVILQEKVIRERFLPGLMHALVFWGFMAFGVITLDHFARGFNGKILGETAYSVYSWVAIPFSILVIIGIVYLAFRRFVLRPKVLGKISITSGIVAIFIALLMGTYLLTELDLPHQIEKVNWWGHTFFILAFLFLIPRSKHLHLVLAPINIFFRPFTIPSHDAVEIDMDASEEELDSMLTGLTKMSRNQALDIFSCVECGRCTDVCPANRGGGILDPKHHFILDLKEPMLSTSDVDVLGQINVEAGWECTACQSCTDICPVGNHVEKSDEIRRHQVLLEGQVPQEYQKVFRNLQESGNTEGAFQSPLAEDLPVYTSDKEYALWLGCFARYGLDPDFEHSVRSFTKILEEAGVSYGVLSQEMCCGDPANRLGDKLTYQMLMDQNKEELQDVKKITSLCPHCVVNLDQEYRKYGEVPYKVEHHTQVISDIIESGKIRVEQGSNEKLTYHDPCNLSRSLNEVDAPRKVLNASSSGFFDMEESGRRTLCCGAGGGLWWKKESKGRTHLVRAQQVVDSGAETVATGCNFCFGMMKQGLGPLTPDNQKEIQVKDIADIVAENLVNN
ncbi:MAG TPA: heterodisulfide reductase-related iron-sulfur binding cluster [Candidatus Marinimicrobia bacterium]|nr:heterodisulfide reductase-related iron-sulfur binding cluster [Candidatus Neomarinimicrobiota bacterium]